MNSPFAALAHRLAEEASQEGGIDAAGIPDLVARLLPPGDECNCYPEGEAKGPCRELLVAVSLNGLLRGRKRGHLPFSELFPTIVRHIQGRCPGRTKQMVIVTDSWWVSDYEKWADNLLAIKQSGVQIEIHLIGKGGLMGELRL